jgi:hypothetical protein
VGQTLRGKKEEGGKEGRKEEGRRKEEGSRKKVRCDATHATV